MPLQNNPKNAKKSLSSCVGEKALYTTLGGHWPMAPTSAAAASRNRVEALKSASGSPSLHAAGQGVKPIIHLPSILRSAVVPRSELFSSELLAGKSGGVFPARKCAAWPPQTYWAFCMQSGTAGM